MKEKVYVVKSVDGWSDEVCIEGIYKTKEGALQKLSELSAYDDDDENSAYYETYDLEE